MTDLTAPLYVDDGTGPRPATADDIRGPAGADGTDGVDGQDGAAGQDGVDGVDGAPGAAGPDDVLVGHAVPSFAGEPAGRGLVWTGAGWARDTYATAAALAAGLAGKSNVGHGHAIADVAALQGTLDAKALAADLAAEQAARAAGDALALPKAGGTMTGALTLAGNPANALHAAPRQYVDAAIAALLNGAGGAYDTLKELQDLLVADEATAAGLAATVAGKLAAAANLSDLANAATARVNLGLNTAATHAHGDYDAAGAAAAAQAAAIAASQPASAVLAAIAALAPTAYGRALLELADAAALRAAAGLGTLATKNAVAVGDLSFDPATQAELDTVDAVHRLMMRFGVNLGGAAAAATWIMFPGSSAVSLLASGATAAAALYLDPARYAAPAGKTLKIKIAGTVMANAVTAPGTNFTIGLYPVTSWGGASGSQPTIATIGAAVASFAINAPAAGAHAAPSENEADFPAAGYYVLAFVTAGATAANSHLNIVGDLAWRHA